MGGPENGIQGTHMKPLTDIGEMRLSEAREDGKDYFFKPSFEAMAAVGAPEEIVSMF